MPLRPLGKKVIGRLLTPAQQESAIIQPFANERKTHAIKVIGVGNGCQEVQVGDVVILPEHGWVRTQLKEDNGVEEFISIPESLLLAVVE